MNIRQIEAFHAVMTTGSVTRAAERMAVSQPAVSQLIALFERRCGFRLFERRGPKLTPTREAEALHAEVRLMIVGTARIERVATAIRDRSWGSISVAAFPALARRVLPGIVARFCAEHPQVSLRIESMRSRSMIDAVAAQHVDIGISVLPGDRPEVESEHLKRLNGICIMPKDHPLAGRAVIRPADLRDQPFVSLGPQDHSRFMIDKIFEEAGVARRMQIEAGQSETALSLVLEGAGLAIVDPICVTNSGDPRIAAVPFEPAVEFDIWLIRPRATGLLNVAAAFIAQLRAQIG